MWCRCHLQLMACAVRQHRATTTPSTTGYDSIYLHGFNLFPHAQISLVWTCTSFCWSLWPRRVWDAQPFAGTLFILRSAASASGRLTKATYHSSFREPWGWGTGQGQSQLPGNGNTQISREKSQCEGCLGPCAEPLRVWVSGIILL